MVVIAFNGRRRFLKTNIIKPGKTSTVYVFDCVIRDEKMFLPSHEYEIRVRQIRIIKRIGIKRFCVLVKRIKFALKQKFIKKLI